MKRPHITPKVRAGILADPCAYCGEIIATHVDHVIPHSRGGSSEPENLAPACRACNYEKLDWTPDEWRQWRLSIGLDWPPPSLSQVFAPILDALTPDELRAFMAATWPITDESFDLVRDLIKRARNGEGLSPVAEARRIALRFPPQERAA